jgi:hypothetical protein
MEWQTDGELDELDRFARGETGPGSGTAMLEALAGLVASDAPIRARAPSSECCAPRRSG